MELYSHKLAIKKIKTKLLLIFILNVSDIVFTLYLISTDYYFEANPLVQPLLNNFNLCILFKVVLPGILLFYLSIRINKANSKQLKYSNILLMGVIIVYSLINISHLIGIIATSFILLMCIQKAIAQ